MSTLREEIERALRTADLVLADGDTRAATNRAYYAMFYTAQYYLNERHFERSRGIKTHSGTRRQFDLLAVKEDGLDPSLSKALSRTDEQRSASDYSFTTPAPTLEETASALATARSFVATVLAAIEGDQ